MEVELSQLRRYWGQGALSHRHPTYGRNQDERRGRGNIREGGASGPVLKTDQVNSHRHRQHDPSGDNDDQWFDLVKAVLYVLINAEELGVTQANVESQAASDNIVIRRMLGAEGEFGQSDLGLDADFGVDVIKAVGIYGEI